MAGLKQLKLKRESIIKTRKVTRAMEAVSAVKMRKAQERALGGRPYATAALRILGQVSETADSTNHLMFEKRTTGAYGMLVVTSDKGLAGSLNSAVLKQVEAFIANPKYTDGEKVFICIGRRGHEYLRARGHTVLHYEENKSDDVNEADMRAVTDVILKEHSKGTTRAWYTAYTNFKSTFEQSAVQRRILPLSQGALQEVVAGIIPEKGAYSDTEAPGRSVSSYTIEPEAEIIFDTIVPELLNVIVYHALLESKASEHSARMVAMKNATDKAGELSHELMLKFNKARQAVITREVSEITSGIEAMK